MHDPYKNLFESISKALTKLSNMICWVAKRTLTSKEFDEFVEEFTDKTDLKNELDWPREDKERRCSERE